MPTESGNKTSNISYKKLSLAQQKRNHTRSVKYRNELSGNDHVKTRNMTRKTNNCDSQVEDKELAREDIALSGSSDLQVSPVTHNNKGPVDNQCMADLGHVPLTASEPLANKMCLSPAEQTMEVPERPEETPNLANVEEATVPNACPLDTVGSDSDSEKSDSDIDSESDNDYVDISTDVIGGMEPSIRQMLERAATRAPSANPHVKCVHLTERPKVPHYTHIRNCLHCFRCKAFICLSCRNYHKKKSPYCNWYREIDEQDIPP